ncbi:MAG TPA: TlpA family protein disulfide reductase [Desulfofustis sp.]|nr:TlpA family protein disulfide reductase [Desulfofustis sp.]
MNIMFARLRVPAAIAVAIFLCTAPIGATLNAAGKMPQFQLQDPTNGDVVKSKDFQGKVVLVTFFATWCVPCVQEIPSLIKLHQSYKNKGFSVVAISVDQEESVVRKLAAKKGINYPIIMGNDAIIQGFGGVFGIPTTFLVNQNGTVVKKYDGYVSHTVLLKDIKRVMDT